MMMMEMLVMVVMIMLFDYDDEDGKGQCLIKSGSILYLKKCARSQPYQENNCQKLYFGRILQAAI